MAVVSLTWYQYRGNMTTMANVFETVAIMIASAKVFQWTNEEVGLLLSAILNCKTSRLEENMNWE